MFRAHMLIIRRSKLYYTASGIITPIGGRLVHETATYRFVDTRGCIKQFWPADDEHMCSKHVEAWNKLIVKQKFCASSWLITETNILRCTDNKLKKKSLIFVLSSWLFYMILSCTSFFLYRRMEGCMSLMDRRICRRKLYRRFRCPCSLWHRSVADRPLRMWVRNSPGSRMFVCCECCVLSGRGVCDELITHPEESYWMWCVVVCDLETSRMRRPWPALGRSAIGRKRNCSSLFVCIRPIVKTILRRIHEIESQ